VRVTLLGVVAVLAGAALLVYIGHELRRRNEENAQGPVDPEPPMTP
jgi:hypothetical protein